MCAACRNQGAGSFDRSCFTTCTKRDHILKGKYKQKEHSSLALYKDSN